MMMVVVVILLEGDLALRCTTEERDGKCDGPRPRSRTVKLGNAPEALGGCRLDGGRQVGSGGGRRQWWIGGGATADVAVWPEQRREVFLALVPEPRELTGTVGGASLLTAQFTYHVAYHVHVLHLDWPAYTGTSNVACVDRWRYY